MSMQPISPKINCTQKPALAWASPLTLASRYSKTAIVSFLATRFMTEP